MRRYTSPHRACLKQNAVESKMHHKDTAPIFLLSFICLHDDKIQALELRLKQLWGCVIIRQSHISSGHNYKVDIFCFQHTMWTKITTQRTSPNTQHFSSAWWPSQYRRTLEDVSDKHNYVNNGRLFDFISTKWISLLQSKYLKIILWNQYG
jgi:hypothetical protein